MTSSSSPTTTRSWGPVVLIVCLAQFMVILDATITLVALPSIQTDLHVAPSDLQWVVNAYMLTFGGFLLLGGRAADLLGRRLLFLVGVGVFTAASALDAAAGSTAMLVGARALQGLGAALVSPAALSIITTTVPEGPDRTKALGAFAAVSGGGGAAGLILGGVLTDALSWQWVFLVNLPVGILAMVAAARFVPETRVSDRRGGFDIAGAMLVTAGLGLLTFAIVRAQDDGWTSARTLGVGAGALALLAAFAAVEQRRAAPLVRLSILRTRTLAAANAATLLLVGGMYSLFFFGTLYFQDIKDYNALQTGLAFLPQTAGVIIGSVVSQRLIARFGAKAVLVGGLAGAAIGLLWMTRLTPDDAYVTGFLPGLVVIAMSLGNAFVPVTLIATSGVARDDQGLASGLFNTSQQVGGALGLAVLSSVAASATHGTSSDALVHGYTTAFGVGSALLMAAALVVLGALRGREVPMGAAEPEALAA
jgi:EmrB/QacA subfamily drug resistance transporter